MPSLMKHPSDLSFRNVMSWHSRVGEFYVSMSLGDEGCQGNCQTLVGDVSVRVFLNDIIDSVGRLPAFGLELYTNPANVGTCQSP